MTTEASQPTAAATETAPAQNSSESQTTKVPESDSDASYASYAACDLPETKEQKDFSGEVETNNDLPSVETQRKIENYVVLDRHGKTHTFKSLYSGRSVARRVLVIFIRHFFCGVSRKLRAPSPGASPLTMRPAAHRTARSIYAP